MTASKLQLRLSLFARTLARARTNRLFALSWTLGTALALALVLFQNISGRGLPKLVWLLPAAFGAFLGAVIGWRHKCSSDSKIGEVVRELEPDQEALRHLLSAAVEQKPSEPSVGLNFLQIRVLEEALSHPCLVSWEEHCRQRLMRSRLLSGTALLILIGFSALLRQTALSEATPLARVFGEEVKVSPGDTQVERGTGLVIAARFGGTPPAEATLVIDSATGGQTRLPMARRLADPIFGAAIPEVSEPGRYHVEYRNRKTRDYTISVFEFPALIRADAELHFPLYTGLTNQTIRDTLRVSAVEGSTLNYTLHLNKAVPHARLVGPQFTLTLQTDTNAVALLSRFQVTNTTRFTLELLDSEGRSNKFATEFVLQAITNQRPLVRLVFPRGDSRVSPLEELHLKAEASDDFGLLAYGIGYAVAGGQPKMIELGKSAPTNTKRQFDYLLALETLKLAEEQSLAYFAWADDYGPDGQPRRTYSDMFFADVRPFEEVFRQDQSESDSGDQQGSQGGGNERTRLAELQKQIVVATWNLQRNTANPASNQHP